MKEDTPEPETLEPKGVGTGIISGDGSAEVGESAAESPQNESLGPPNTSGGPPTKRRRITRACDECRKKKIKCDGKQVNFFILIR